MEAMLAKMVGEHHRDWDKHLQQGRMQGFGGGGGGGGGGCV